MGLENDIARFADRLAAAHGDESIAIARRYVDDYQREGDPSAGQIWSQILQTLEGRTNATRSG